MMRRRFATVLLLFAAGHGAAGAADTEEVIERLALWQEDPLDLLAADPAELALLPGWDGDLARAVVELRQAGELSSLEDLRRIPGVARVQIELMRPYVRIGAGGARRSGRWRAVGQDRSGRATWIQNVDLASGPLEVVAIARGPAPSRVVRGAAVYDVGSGSGFLFGDLAFTGAPTLLGFSSRRTTVGPAPFLPALRVRPRRDSSPDPGLRGVAFGSSGRGFAFVGRDPRARPCGGGALRIGGSASSIGVAVRVGESGPPGAEVAVLRSTEPAQVWILAAAESDARFSGAGARIGGARWRAGLDASACAGRFRRGIDPVSGRALDRARSVLQVHLRLREADWSLSAYAREIDAGSIAPSTDSRLEVELRRSAIRPGRPGVAARLKLLPNTIASAAVSFAVPGGVLRCGVESSRTASGATEVWSADWMVRGKGQDLRAGLTSVAGASSRMGLVSRPGIGVYPVWVGPGEVLLRVGSGRQGAHGRLSAWAWFRSGGARAGELGLGMAFEVRAGELVQRLQGAQGGPPGTGRPAIDPAARRMAP